MDVVEGDPLIRSGSGARDGERKVGEKKKKEEKEKKKKGREPDDFLGADEEE